MNLPNLNYVIGNATTTDEYKDRQMEAKDSTQVVVSNTANANKEEDVWSIVPEPGPNVIVTFQSKKHKDHFLNTNEISSVTCTANLNPIGSKFLLEFLEMDGNERIYNIKVIEGSTDCINKYLTMDDPKGGKGIQLMDKMPQTSSKQKWKFKSAPTGGAGTN